MTASELVKSAPSVVAVVNIADPAITWSLNSYGGSRLTVTVCAIHVPVISIFLNYGSLNPVYPLTFATIAAPS